MTWSIYLLNLDLLLGTEPSKLGPIENLQSPSFKVSVSVFSTSIKQITHGIIQSDWKLSDFLDGDPFVILFMTQCDDFNGSLFGHSLDNCRHVQMAPATNYGFVKLKREKFHSKNNANLIGRLSLCNITFSGSNFCSP